MEKFKEKIAERRQKVKRTSDRYEGLTLKPIYDNMSRELQENLSENIYKTITQEIPNSLLRSQIIKQKEQFRDGQFLQFAVTELHYQFDKFDDQLRQIEGNPEEMRQIQIFLAETDRKNREIIHNALEAVEDLASEVRELALQRRRAKFEDEVLQFEVKIKDYPNPLMPFEKINETNSRFQSVLREVQERNRRDLNKMILSLRKGNNS